MVKFQKSILNVPIVEKNTQQITPNVAKEYNLHNNNKKNRPKHKHSSKHASDKFVPAPQLNGANFPSNPRKAYQRDAWQQQPPRLKSSNSNKHKPNNETNELLSGDELIEAFQELKQRLKSANTIEQIFYYKNKCSKKFPKIFQDTKLDQNGFPVH